jgi:hypothetical protein
MNPTNYYVDPKSLLEEIKISIEAKKLTKAAEGMLIKIAYKANDKLPYDNVQDKEDCISSALLEIFRYWDRFNIEKTNNAFAYYTQIAKNGYVKGWMQLHPAKKRGNVSLSRANDSEGLYNI